MSTRSPCELSASARCATRRTLAQAPPLEQRGVEVRAPPPHSAAAWPAAARRAAHLAGQLEAYTPQAPYALAKEHLGPGVPVVRAPQARKWVLSECRVFQTCSSVRCRGASQLVHRQPVLALVARARVPPAAPPAPDDHRRVDQVLVVLVAEEALAQTGQPALSPLQLLLPVTEEDLVVGPLSDEGWLQSKSLLESRRWEKCWPARVSPRASRPRAAPQV